MLDVYPDQINAVAPNTYPGAVSPNVPNERSPDGQFLSVTEVWVTTGCGTSTAAQSIPQIVTITPASPEFFYFQRNANWQNPVRRLNAQTGAYLGPTELGSGVGPAHPGDLVTIFVSGFGAVNPPIMPGAFATGPAEVMGSVSVTLGSVTLNPSDVV